MWWLFTTLDPFYLDKRQAQIADFREHAVQCGLIN
jgi:hypothetical protein